MKLTREELKDKAEHVRKYFNEADRKLVAPLFQMIKALQDEIALIQSMRQEMLPQFDRKKENIRFPLWVPPAKEPGAINFKDYVKNLLEEGLQDKIEMIAKVKGITVEKLLEVINGADSP